MRLKLAATHEEISFLYETRNNKSVRYMLNTISYIPYYDHLKYIKENQNKKVYIYIAYEGNTMVGYCQYKFNMYNEIEVGFVIHPIYQGFGYSKKMIRELIELLTKKDTKSNIVLFVKKYNKKAIKIYEDLGFHEVIDYENEIKMALQ